MSVPIGHAQIAVVEYFREFLQIDPVHTSEARIRMPQIVEAEVGDARTLACADERDGDLDRLQIGEEQSAPLSLPSLIEAKTSRAPSLINAAALFRSWYA